MLQYMLVLESIDMADGVEFSIIGMGELIGKLESVKEDTRRRGGRFALRKAAQVIVEESKQNAERIDDPETGRKISENIKERWSNRRFRQTGDLMFRIGVLGGGNFSASRGNPDTGAGGPTPHWHLIELGTKHARAQPFLRPAASDNINQVIDVFSREYIKAIDRAIKRAQKKGETA